MSTYASKVIQLLLLIINEDISYYSSWHNETITFVNDKQEL